MKKEKLSDIIIGVLPTIGGLSILSSIGWVIKGDDIWFSRWVFGIFCLISYALLKKISK